MQLRAMRTLLHRLEVGASRVPSWSLRSRRVSPGAELPCLSLSSVSDELVLLIHTQSDVKGCYEAPGISLL